jgi:hypothetical protein
MCGFALVCGRVGVCDFTMSNNGPLSVHHAFVQPALTYATMLTSQLYYTERGPIASSVQTVRSVPADLVQLTQNRAVTNGARCWHSEQ